MPPPIYFNFTAPAPHVQITALVPSSCAWTAIRGKRRNCDRIIQEAWHLREGTSWTAEDWVNHDDWRRLGFLHTEPVPLNLLVMVGYGADPFFSEGIRLQASQKPLSKLAVSLGQFLSDRLVSLPLPQQERDGVIIKDLAGTSNQILWLGFLLQAARSVWASNE
jgi:hypothetical protein